MAPGAATMHKKTGKQLMKNGSFTCSLARVRSRTLSLSPVGLGRTTTSAPLDARICFAYRDPAVRPRFSLACGVPRRQVARPGRAWPACALTRCPPPLGARLLRCISITCRHTPERSRLVRHPAPPVLCVHKPRSDVADLCALHPCAGRRAAARRGTVWRVTNASHMSSV